MPNRTFSSVFAATGSATIDASGTPCVDKAILEHVRFRPVEHTASETPVAPAHDCVRRVPLVVQLSRPRRHRIIRAPENENHIHRSRGS